MSDERKNVYECVRNVTDNTRKMSNAEKIRILYNKWLRIQNGENDNGISCNDIIQGLVISIAYEKKDFDLMCNIAKKS
jgi:hypothetical protein